MKFGTIRTIYIIVGICMLCSLNSLAQEKEIIDGKSYYVHIVEKGHTMYAISKMFAIDINVLYAQNPEAINGLGIGQRILIPVSQVTPKELRAAPEMKGEGLAHKVAKKETLYSISKKYQVDINEIIQRNPGAESGIVKGDVIIIPIEKAKVQNTVAIEPATEEMNKLPIEDTYQGAIDQTDLSNISEFYQNVESEEITGEPLQEINIGLLLPFSFSYIDTTSIPEVGRETYRMTDIALEFYRGVQMALKKQDNININLFVYDISKDDAAINRFLKKDEISDLDVVIGPLHGSSFKKISKELSNRGVHFVSPLTNSMEVIEGNSFCSKVSPSNISHINYIADRISDDNLSKNVIVIDSQLEKDKKLLNAYISKHKAKFMGKLPTVIKLAKYDNLSLVNAMTDSLKNIFVVPSTDKPFVSNFFTTLSDDALKDYDMDVYGIEPWLKYDNISIEQKNRFNLRISASKYFNYEDDATVDFLKSYRSTYNTIPVAEGYGAIAYDITGYYVDGLYDYGEVFLENLNAAPANGIITGFQFEKLPNGGWQNDYNFLLEYDNFDLIKVD